MNINGLNSYDVEYRKNNDMVNNEDIKNSRSVKTILLSNVITLFNFIHLILFILVLTTGMINNATFIIAILFNMFISIYQELKAKKIIDKLSITNVSKVRVIRDGKEEEILPSEVVLDDLLYLKQGDSLIVDAEVVKSDACEVDESVITGESDSIIKNPGDKLISGSIIVCGNVYAKVTSINRNTYANNLIKEASSNVDDSSYLKKCINTILKVVTILIVPVGILLFITQFFYSDQSYSESILSSVAGIIGMIPEGLVLLTSISLTVGVIKMAAKKVIVQKLNGIELLACVDILCLDKTGTITDGSMEVVDVIKINKDIEIENIISNMVRDKVNVTDIAIANYFGINEDLNVIEHIPFSSSRKYSLVKYDIGTYALGALEYITNKQIDEFDMLNEFVDNGYRIITLVKCMNSFNKDDNEIVAFIVLKDNVRKNAKETLEYFKEQNVDIKIISGDNPRTVSNILKQLSMDDYDKYISGDKLPEEYEKLKEMVSNYKIYGRVTPYQKQSIIKALKENATVGMIGDGVNDILALKEADCSIALASGISAARSVSQIVLIDSDFSLLPEIVYEGRRVVNNIERVASLFLVKTTYSLLLSLMSIILTQQYPFYPIQLSLISTVCVGLPSFFLALEPNHTKVKRGFVRKVLRNAFPAGICVFLNILILSFYSMILGVEIIEYNLVIVTLTGMINLLILYKISLPLSLHRKVLLITCSIFFFGLLIAIPQVFQLGRYTWVYVAMIIALFIIDIYIIKGLEWLYDKISKKFIEI